MFRLFPYSPQQRNYANMCVCVFVPSAAAAAVVAQFNSNDVRNNDWHKQKIYINIQIHVTVYVTQENNHNSFYFCIINWIKKKKPKYLYIYNNKNKTKKSCGVVGFLFFGNSIFNKPKINNLFYFCFFIYGWKQKFIFHYLYFPFKLTFVSIRIFEYKIT